MKSPTSYNGIDYAVGESYSLDRETEKRWVKNGIAEEVIDRKPTKPITVQEETNEQME